MPLALLSAALAAIDMGAGAGISETRSSGVGAPAAVNEWLWNTNGVMIWNTNGVIKCNAC